MEGSSLTRKSCTPWLEVAPRNKADAVERRAIGALFADVTEAGAHRDGMFRIIRDAAK